MRTLEARLQVTEAALVEEQQRSKATAATAAQALAQPAAAAARGANSLVDTRAIGKPPPFSGDIDAEGKPVDSLPWTQWAFVFRAYVGAYDVDAKKLLQECEAKTEGPKIMINADMTADQAKLSNQICYALALTLRGKSLQVVRRVPDGARL